MIKYEYLQPLFDNRKSFYKKAKVFKTDNETILMSYNTVVLLIPCDAPEGEYYLRNCYSATTLRHIKEFLIQYGGFSAYGLTKKNIEKWAKRLDNIDWEETERMVTETVNF